MPNGDSTISQSQNTKEPSARKLAATLWEINPPLVGDSKLLPNFPHLSDPSYTPTTTISEKMIDHPCRGITHAHSHRRRTSLVPKKIQLTHHNLDSVCNATLMEIKGKTCTIGIKSGLKDVRNGLTASKELLKVLNRIRIWGGLQLDSSATSLVSALGVELDQARVQVDQLIRSNCNEIECLVKHFEEEKAAWKSKERDRVRNAIAEELQVEKKLRRQTERLNKKLGMELADTKASLSQALKELDSEKRAKEILEQVCNELAKGIGEDRAQVEQLKRESVKVKEEVEKEREMLQLADVLREERVQMKLSEARYHFEEKNAAVDRLRHELEAYLQEKVVAGSPNYERIKELEAYLKEIRRDAGSSPCPCPCPRGRGRDTEENENGDDSADNSDLHSIELNMDNNSKSYKWSYACDGIALNLDNMKRASVERDLKGISDNNIQWGSICLQGRNCNGIDDPDSDFISKNTEISNELSQHTHHEDEIMRYKSVTDHILSAGSTRQPMKNFASPTANPAIGGYFGQFTSTEG